MLLTVNTSCGAAWCYGVADDFVGKLRKSFIRNNRVKKISSEPDAVIKRTTSGSRVIGSRPQVYGSAYFWGCKKILPKFHLVFPK